MFILPERTYWALEEYCEWLSHKVRVDFSVSYLNFGEFGLWKV